ncbi:g10787 [Coccomyxa elongata]
MDVVPVTSLAAWTEPPFSGVIKDGYVWGRGAQDVKVTVFALLEAVTALLEQRFAPKRTLYLAFGHDEEVGGGRGAKAIAAMLEARGVQLEFVLDEGGPLLVDGLRPFVKSTAVALVGTAEKGYVSVDVILEGKGGHSSLPPVDGSMALSRLSRLLTAIDGSLPPAKIVSPTLEFLQGVGHASDNPVIKWVLSRCHTWPLNQLLARFLASQPGEVASAVRTTIAATAVTTHPSAGNVIPSLASAHFNFRYLPGEEEDFAQRYLQAFLKGDGKHGKSSLQVHERFEMASAVTPVNSTAFALVRQAILETLAKDRAVAVVPFLLTGGTDSKHYQALCGGRTLRFAPVAMNRTAGDLKRVHGIDERVSTEAFLDAIRFFTRFLSLALA